MSSIHLCPQLGRDLRAVLADIAGILLPHNANPRLRLVRYPCHWTKGREADVAAYIRIGKMAWAVDFR